MKLILTTNDGQVIDTIERVQDLELERSDVAQELAFDLAYSIRIIGEFMEKSASEGRDDDE